MLKIIKDVTIRHNGKEISCKAGQIVNVRASFDINDDVAKGVEIRNADKFRRFVKLIKTNDKSKTITLQPIPNHNSAEQKLRKEDKEIIDAEEKSLEELAEEIEQEEKTDEGKEEKEEEKKAKGGKKKD